MLTVYNCITVDHDLRLVLLAAFICMFASFSALNLLIHAGRDAAWRRTLWVLGAGTVAGCGIWATHFIAMLAFRPSEQLSYDPGTTVLSFIVAIVFSTIGFAIAARVKPAGIGGAIVGIIGAMHYIGMAAVNTHGYIVWDRGFVAASIILGTLFASAATQAAFSLRASGAFMPHGCCSRSVFAAFTLPAWLP